MINVENAVSAIDHGLRVFASYESFAWVAEVVPELIDSLPTTAQCPVRARFDSVLRSLPTSNPVSLRRASAACRAIAVAEAAQHTSDRSALNCVGWVLSLLRLAADGVTVHDSLWSAVVTAASDTGSSTASRTGAPVAFSAGCAASGQDGFAVRWACAAAEHGAWSSDRATEARGLAANRMAMAMLDVLERACGIDG